MDFAVTRLFSPMALRRVAEGDRAKLGELREE